MVSLPNIGFSLYPEEPVSTFRSVGKAAFPNIIAAPSPFEASPLPPPPGNPATASRLHAKEGAGLFARPDDAVPKFSLPTRPATGGDVQPAVSLSAFEQLRKQVQEIATLLTESDPLLKSALDRITDLEAEVLALREAYQDDPFAAAGPGIPLMFNSHGGGGVFDLSMLAGAMPCGSKGMTFMVSDEEGYKEGEVNTWYAEKPDGGSDGGCEEYKESMPEQDSESDSNQGNEGGYESASVSLEHDDNSGGGSDGAGEDDGSASENISASEGVESASEGVESASDEASEGVESASDEASNGIESASDEASDKASNDDADSASETERDFKTTEPDDLSSKRASASASASASDTISISNVRTITFANAKQHKLQKQSKTHAVPLAYSANNATAAATLATAIVAKSDREMSRLLVPELTEMLAVFGETYTPPKQESVALLLRLAAETVKATAAASGL